MTAPDQPSGLLLIIDDQPQNLHMLSSTLRGHGYKVAAANSGESALHILERLQPDLILCDIVMPGMDGYEVCRQVKAQAHTRDIPLIFLTAKTDSDDIVHGFSAGAVDYVVKPFNPAELLARVHTHLSLKQARDTILAYTRDLESLNEEKNNFLGIAAHDLKNPLSTILLTAQMVAFKQDSLSSEKLTHYMGSIENEVERMLQIITNLLDINRIESGSWVLHPIEVELQPFLQTLSEAHQVRAQAKRIRLQTDFATAPLLAITDRSILQQIVDNLLSNAIKYSPPEREVVLGLARHGKLAVLRVQDQGPGFSEGDKGRVFQKFARLSARPTAGENSTGLGLSIVKQLTHLLGADIHLESPPGQGATFTLTLPIL
jgi:two-component system sensor histidine kinase/response regulator